MYWIPKEELAFFDMLDVLDVEASSTEPSHWYSHHLVLLPATLDKPSIASPVAIWAIDNELTPLKPQSHLQNVTLETCIGQVQDHRASFYRLISSADSIRCAFSIRCLSHQSHSQFFKTKANSTNKQSFKMERELTEAEIQEILREEGLVLKPTTQAPTASPSNSMSKDLDLAESELRLQAILDGEEEPRGEKSRLPRKVKSFDRTKDTKKKSLLRSVTDSNVTKKLTPKLLLRKKTWSQEEIKSLHPQQAVALLEKVSASNDYELANALIKSMKGKGPNELPKAA